MLVKWNPLVNGSIAPSAPMPVFDELFREADKLFGGAFAYPSSWNAGSSALATDISETQDNLVISMDLPGYDPASINVQVEGDLLTVHAQRAAEKAPQRTWLRNERAFGQAARSFVLPQTVDPTKCTATCEHGVLTLTLPKREESKPRTITVKVTG